MQGLRAGGEGILIRALKLCLYYSSILLWPMCKVGAVRGKTTADLPPVTYATQHTSPQLCLMMQQALRLLQEELYESLVAAELEAIEAEREAQLQELIAEFEGRSWRVGGDVTTLEFQGARTT